MYREVSLILVRAVTGRAYLVVLQTACLEQYLELLWNGSGEMELS